MSTNRTKASEEQLIYANILNWGMWIGLAILTLSFIIYMSGILPGFVAVKELPKYWGLSSAEFHLALQSPIGWQWLGVVGKGDYLNFVGIALLAGLTIVCYAAIIPALKRKKDTAYLVISVLEILVLVLAASGLLKAGH